MKIKRGILALILTLAFCSAGVYAGSMMEYEIPELDLGLELPAEYNYVFTKDMDADDSAFVDLGISKESLFENKSLYLEALTEDQNAEVIVTMMDTDWSQVYYDFNELENSDLLEMAQVCLVDTDSAANMEISNCDIFEGNDQAKFLKADGVFADEDNDGYAIQYVTVLNGNAYTITFNFYGGEISDEEDAMTEAVVSSASFHTVEAKDTGHSNAIYIGIIAVMAVIIVVLLYYIHKKHYTIKSGHVANEEQASSLPEKETEAATETETQEEPRAGGEAAENAENKEL